MSFGIVHLEMVALGTWIGDVRTAHLLYLFQEFRASQDRQAQLLPILALATRDHIVNGRKAQTLVINMPVNHRLSRLSLASVIMPALTKLPTAAENPPD